MNYFTQYISRLSTTITAAVWLKWMVWHTVNYTACANAPCILLQVSWHVCRDYETSLVALLVRRVSIQTVIVVCGPCWCRSILPYFELEFSSLQVIFTQLLRRPAHEIYVERLWSLSSTGGSSLSLSLFETFAVAVLYSGMDGNFQTVREDILDSTRSQSQGSPRTRHSWWFRRRNSLLPWYRFRASVSHG